MRLIIPGDGKFFCAPPSTPMPAAGPAAFTLNGPIPDGWDQLAETSYENTMSFNKDGGDKTVKRTWEHRNVRVQYADQTISITANAVEISRRTLQRIQSAWQGSKGGMVIPAAVTATEMSVFVLACDGADSTGWYSPNWSLGPGDGTEIDTENFLEMPFEGMFMDADPEIIEPDPATGLSGLYIWFTPEDFLPTPTALTVSPAGATSVKVGSTVQLSVAATPPKASNEAVWSSADLSKATVSATGLVTGVAAGSATITATSAVPGAGKVKADKAITVTAS